MKNKNAQAEKRLAQFQSLINDYLIIDRTSLVELIYDLQHAVDSPMQFSTEGTLRMAIRELEELLR